MLFLFVKVPLMLVVLLLLLALLLAWGLGVLLLGVCLQCCNRREGFSECFRLPVVRLG